MTTTPTITIGDAVDWAADHRNVVNAWVTQEATKHRMPAKEAASHRYNIQTVFDALFQMVRSVDAMQDGSGFAPLQVTLPELREAEAWLKEHAGRMVRWAEAARAKHRTQSILMPSYQGPKVDGPNPFVDGDPTPWWKERQEVDPWTAEPDQSPEDLGLYGRQIVHRSYGLSPEAAVREVLSCRLALRAVRSLREASEQEQRGGTFPVPSIVREAMP